MLKLTKMLSLAGTFIVLGTIHSAQGAVVVSPSNGNPVEKITGVEVLNSDGSAIEIFTVDFQFDTFVTTFGNTPSSQAFFLDNSDGALLALTAINDAMNAMTLTNQQVRGITSFAPDSGPIINLMNYRIPILFDPNDNEVETMIGQFTNGAWVGGTTQMELADGNPPNGLVMYAKFTKTGEIDLTPTPPTVPEPSNLVSILVCGVSLLFVAKNRI